MNSPAAAHAAQATTASPHQVKGKTVQHHGIRPNATGPQWAPLSETQTFYKRGGGTSMLTDGVLVFVTCYYSGAPGPDPYWDHITGWYPPGAHHIHSVTGHVADRHVSFPGHKYPFSVGIPHC
jgi:hypothetical protein